MKGIVLAGGNGSRLYPLTTVISKQLLPLYDKPMVYYPVSSLMLAGIRDILIISTSQDLDRFEKLLGDGSRFGINFQYAVQNNPVGIPDAFRIGKNFIDGDNVMLILGDNIFIGHHLSILFTNLVENLKGAAILGYQVSNPEHFGVIKFRSDGTPASIVEKPKFPPSRFVVPGIYCFDHTVVEKAENCKLSPRGELEIVDVINMYLNEGNCYFEKLGRGVAWFDAGTADSLLEAAQLVYSLESRQGLKLACLEEIALLKGWISDHQIKEQVRGRSPCGYVQYLDNLISGPSQ